MLKKANKARFIGIVNCILFLGLYWFYKLDKIGDNIFSLITIFSMTIIILLDGYIFYHDKNRDLKIIFIAHILLLIWIIYIVITRG